jgi:hypothetical protein
MQTGAYQLGSPGFGNFSSAIVLSECVACTALQRLSPYAVDPLTQPAGGASLLTPVSDGLALGEPNASGPVTLLKGKQIGRNRPWIGRCVMSSSSYPLNIVLNEEEHKALEIWRVTTKLTTRSAAVVELMRAGLESQGFSVGTARTYTDWSKLS